MAKEKGVKGIMISVGKLILYAGLIAGCHWVADNASDTLEATLNTRGVTKVILEPVTLEQQVADFVYHITPQPIFTGVIDYVNSARIQSDNTFANQYINDGLNRGSIRVK